MRTWGFVCRISWKSESELFASQDNTDFTSLLGPLGGGRPCFLLPDESVVGGPHDIGSIVAKKRQIWTEEPT